ncbi:esterase/lipase family protein [Paludisphaera soli]|uniref:esterase/lipase family protein n=1 Tax=Paludisphaera soli TaxID=2712865 RepID=UPI0013EC88F0|nr:lysophospholipase [Paludisphaera soli]
MFRSIRTNGDAPRRLRAMAFAAALLAPAAGEACRGGGVEARPAKVRNALRDGLDRLGAAHTPSAFTREVLARRGLTGLARGDAAAAARQLEADLLARPGEESDGALALADLWLRAGLRLERDAPADALACFRDSSAAAMLALAQARGGCRDQAVAIHNDAVARLIRLSQDERVRGDGPWIDALARLGVACEGAGPFVDPSRFASVEVCDDIRVRGMRRVYQSPGLGVPTVASRTVDRGRPTEPSEAFYARNLRIGATVTAAPVGGGWRPAAVSLAFHDPYETTSLDVGGVATPMAADVTTPLAVQVSMPLLSLQTTLGLFRSDFQEGVETGLYMLMPWQPGKIPVVLVHGLSSNPGAFVQTINELRNDPEIGGRFQFLVFAYPTGRPIPASGLSLRRSLDKAERAFGGDPAFHRMILAGHSMGGILTRMMVTDSGDRLWNAVLRVPPEGLRADPEVRAELEEMLIYRPVPFVRRAVFIAAPHRGSRIADEPFGRLISRLVRPPDRQAAVVAQLRADNGPDVFRENVFRGRSITSIGNLSPSSPVLTAVADLPIAPGVTHHTIAYRFAGVAPNDLVVPAWSSDLPDDASHLDLPGTHFSEQSPGTVVELRRILIEHLREQDAT